MELWDVRDWQGGLKGYTAVRGDALASGDHHLVVFVILRTEDKHYLSSQRALCKPCGGMWECVGGSVTAGEDSLTGALREVGEEVGLKLTPGDLELLERQTFKDQYPFLIDVYRYTGPIDMSQLSLQEEEVADAKMVSEEEMRRVIQEGPFFNRDFFNAKYFD